MIINWTITGTYRIPDKDAVDDVTPAQLVNDGEVHWLDIMTPDGEIIAKQFGKGELPF